MSTPQAIPDSTGTSYSDLAEPGAPVDPWLPLNYLDLAHSFDFAEFETWLYSPGVDGEEDVWTPLPSLVCTGARFQIGSRPPIATFKYLLGDGNADAPQTWEDAMGNADLPEVLNPGDRIVVIARQVIRQTTGVPIEPLAEIFFDGLPVGFNGTLGCEGESYVEAAGLMAIGACKYALDIPFGGAMWRGSDNPYTSTFVQTSLRPEFNPKGDGNATVKYDATQPGLVADVDYQDDEQYHFPVMIDPNTTRSPAICTTFTLPMSVAHLVYGGLTQQQATLDDAEDESGAAAWLKALSVPARADLDDMLIAKVPIDGKVFDPSDSETYTTDDIVVPNTPIGGRPWPTTTEALIGDKGFLFLWTLETDASTPTENPSPKWSVTIRPSNEGETKDLYLQARGSDLDDDKSNANTLAFNRDLSDAPNHIIVDGAPVVYEIAVILGWGFDPDSFSGGDDDLNKASPNFKGDAVDLWRKYTASEDGSPSIQPYGGPLRSSLDKFDTVLGTNYLKRRRPALGDLVTTDSDGKTLQPKLFWSRDYPYNVPLTSPPIIWDGTSGTWTEVTSGEWKLLEDQLGVYLTPDHPNNFRLGKDAEDKSYFAALASSSAFGTYDDAPIVFMLVCAIEGDEVCTGEAKRRDSAALVETVQRRVDASDRIKKEIVTANSWYNRTTDDVIARDDSTIAEAEAIAMRDSMDAGILDGPITVPRFTTLYKPGDRIASVNGRGLSLRTDGDEASPAAIVPIVQSVTYHLDGGQSVTLELSDSNVMRRRHRRHRA